MKGRKLSRKSSPLQQWYTDDQRGPSIPVRRTQGKTQLMIYVEFMPYPVSIVLHVS